MTSYRYNGYRYNGLDNYLGGYFTGDYHRQEYNDYDPTRFDNDLSHILGGIITLGTGSKHGYSYPSNNGYVPNTSGYTSISASVKSSISSQAKSSGKTVSIRTQTVYRG